MDSAPTIIQRAATQSFDSICDRECLEISVPERRYLDACRVRDCDRSRWVSQAAKLEGGHPDFLFYQAQCHASRIRRSG